MTSSSFGKSLASLRMTSTVRTNVRLRLPSMRIIGIPITSKKRNAVRALMSTLYKRCIAYRICSPLVHAVASDCKVVRRGKRGATVVSVTSTDNVALVSRGRHSPFVAAACNAKRLVTSTCSHKYHRFVMNINNDTAGSTKGKVLRTLNYHFLSIGKGALTPNKGSLGRLSFVSVSRVSGSLLSSRFAVVYSIYGPLFKRRKTTCIFTPRGKTSPTRVRVLSGNLGEFTTYMGARFRASVTRLPKTNTTKKLNTTFVTFFGTILGPNVGAILSMLYFRGCLSNTSLIVAKRKGMSRRALVKGIPRKVLALTRGCSVPIIVLNKTMRDHRMLATTNFLNMFYVRSSTVSLSRTLGTDVAIRGLGRATSRVMELLSFRGF